MKYANYIKYMNSFPKAEGGTDISLKRLNELCGLLGRVNIGIKSICLPDGSTGHACAVLLESIIEKSGLRAGRISSAYGFDSRKSVYVNKKIPSIEDFSKSVEALQAAVQKMPGQRFCREEVTFALSLLLCRLSGCDYVIFEGTTQAGFSLDSVCTPYDLIVMPTVYENKGASDKIKPLCDAIRRGVREVISGNQRSEVYNIISNFCAMSGIRLYIPVKSQFAVAEASLKRLSFSYGGRDGYILKSPSFMLRDCAMLCIETALAIRRAGVKIPWSAIQSGLSDASGYSCFDLISASPVLLTDSARSCEEIKQLLKTIDSLNAKSEKLSICVRFENDELLRSQISAFEDREIEQIILFSDQETEISDLGSYQEKIGTFKTLKSCAKRVIEISRNCDTVICFGSVEFAEEVKGEILKIMSY